MTLAKLAIEAGVSVSTVSKAFSGSREISDCTREHIFDTAKRLGCYDKYRKLKYEKAVFAIILPEIKSEYYHRLAITFEEKIAALGGTTLISSSGFDAEKNRELFRYYSEFCKVDGIIIFGDISLIDNSESFPAVAITTKSTSNDFGCININLESGLTEAIKELQKKGHSRIAFAGEPLTNEKKALFIKCMNICGLYVRDDYIFVSDKRFGEAGRDCFDAFFGHNCATDCPTAVVCGYDYIALGLIEASREHNMLIPQDFSVIGIDNIGFSARSDISLSSIEVNQDEICNAVLTMLHDKMQNKYTHCGECITVPTRFVCRNSIGKADK